ncbi:MAG TPA: biosynthetic peptidoglycan transglycosylase [Polyangiaceae bacterium]|nr:biosynthetic peptidoglycan transglycosylase [Polyangiaceae bacterium]
MSLWRGLAERWLALASPIRRLVVGGVATAAVAALLLWVVIPWWIASAVEERAHARGLDVKVGGASVGLGRVRLEHVRARDPLLPGSSVKVESVAISRGWSTTEVHLAGVEVDLSGSTEQLIERWRALFPAKPKPGSEPSSGSARSVEARAISGLWRDPQSGKQVQLWNGLLQQAPDGGVSIGWDRARAVLPEVQLDVKNVQAELSRASVGAQSGGNAGSAEGLSRRFERVQVGSITAELVIRADEAEPVVTPSKVSVGTPGATEARMETWPAKLRALQSAIRSFSSERFTASVGALILELHRGDESLRIGPSGMRARRGREDAYLDVTPDTNGSSSGTPFAMHAHLPLREGQVSAELSGGPVPLSTLGIREGDMGLVSVREARIEAQAKVAYDPANPIVEISSRGRLENARLRRPALAQQELSDIRLGWRVAGRMSASFDELTLSEGEFSVGDVRVDVAGAIQRDPAPLRLDLKAEMPLTACSALLDALPRGMAPLLTNVRMQGTLAARGLLHFDIQKPLATNVRLDVKNQCRIAEVPPTISPRRFRNPWTREVKGADGLPMTIESGPGSPDWTPYEDISPYLETAIIVCEDAGFFSHHGLDYRAIENSIRMNLEAGKFLRGASTVSMQLAKNLYLGREKTISRKFQEAILTQLLEQELSKHELLELYLNVIEFGPGIYGIRQASRHYFNEEPRDLSLGQALYLASILPSPDTQHFAPDGRVTERWSGYLRRLMQIARKIKRISDDELRAAEGEQVAFRKPNENPPRAPDYDSEDVPPEL